MDNEEDVLKLLIEDDNEFNDLDIDPDTEELLLNEETNFCDPEPVETGGRNLDTSKKDLSDDLCDISKGLEETSAQDSKSDQQAETIKETDDDSDSDEDRKSSRSKRSRFKLEKKPRSQIKRTNDKNLRENWKDQRHGMKNSINNKSINRYHNQRRQMTDHNQHSYLPNFSSPMFSPMPLGSDMTRPLFGNNPYNQHQPQFNLMLNAGPGLLQFQPNDNSFSPQQPQLNFPPQLQQPGPIPLMQNYLGNNVQLLSQPNYVNHNEYDLINSEPHLLRPSPLLTNPPDVIQFNQINQPIFNSIQSERSHNLFMPNKINNGDHNPNNNHQHHNQRRNIEHSNSFRPDNRFNSQYELRPMNVPVAIQSNSPVLRHIPLISDPPKKFESTHSSFQHNKRTNQVRPTGLLPAPSDIPLLRLPPQLGPMPDRSRASVPEPKPAVNKIRPINSITTGSSLKWTNPNVDKSASQLKTSISTKATDKVVDKGLQMEKLKNELGIDEDYMKKLEEQKKIREQIAAKKANQRKMFAVICDQSATGQLPMKATQQTDSTKSVAVGLAKTTNSTTEGDLTEIKKPRLSSPMPTRQVQMGNTEIEIKVSPNAQSSAKNGQKVSIAPAALKNVQPSEVVKISGLNDSVRESAIRKLCRPYGMVTSIEFILDSTRNALVKFANLKQAQNFVKNCQVSTVDNCPISVQFNWFVLLI